MGFKVGDRVEWDTHAGGSYRKRVGSVVAVVPDNRNPADYIPSGMHGDGLGFSRRGESYLLRSGERGTRVFWPYVGRIRPADSVADESATHAARVEGARLALEAAAAECEAESRARNRSYLDDDADQCAIRIRALSPESIVKEGK